MTTWRWKRRCRRTVSPFFREAFLQGHGPLREPGKPQIHQDHRPYPGAQGDETGQSGSFCGVFGKDRWGEGLRERERFPRFLSLEKREEHQRKCDQSGALFIFQRARGASHVPSILLLNSFHPERVLFRPGGVNLRAFLCGVPKYASAQALAFLDRTKNASFPNRKLQVPHPLFPDGR